MRDVVRGHQTVDILKPEKEEDSDTERNDQHDDVVTKQDKYLPSCFLHDKERVGKTVSFDLSNEMKQDRNNKRKTYVGSYGKTYYPTYANKPKGLCKMNNSKRKNDFIILSK